ncbi:Ribonuclease BN, tRNA processing enzyme [Salinimicrobium sediminis]|uniref:Ribonuclease BN, tRNA processing enzyme n=1 Tax=Salinimicrobium sediminis TaxID=1343891 RepID=A0A285X988_9FLAO|nr:MBL fold metallo-hydrolase [Salinimicrobium sediminis]MDX1752511.1 MBL fold metallo-hydrolase [Salinimicrobium sediminis]SOC81344.1 Ribonuclease BN, tRNA processing enzyme [Salinimicrobium sediminis]
MKIRILGTRGKIEPKAEDHVNHTGFLIDEKILVDVGEEKYMDYRPEAVVFTHFHPDHAFFVPEKQKFSPKIPLFGPEAHELIPQLKVITGPFEIDGYKFTPVPVIHALRLKSLGYIIQKGQKKVFITGDVAWIEKANLAEISNLDLVITEATFIQKGGRINRKKDRIFGHTGIPDLIRLLSPLSPKIAFCHYGEWFFENKAEESKEWIKSMEADVELIPAYDGMQIEI